MKALKTIDESSKRIGDLLVKSDTAFAHQRFADRGICGKG